MLEAETASIVRPQAQLISVIKERFPYHQVKELTLQRKLTGDP